MRPSCRSARTLSLTAGTTGGASRQLRMPASSLATGTPSSWEVAGTAHADQSILDYGATATAEQVGEGGAPDLEPTPRSPLGSCSRRTRTT